MQWLQYAVFSGSILVAVNGFSTNEPDLQLRLPSLHLKDNQQPSELFGKPAEIGKESSLNIIPSIRPVENMSLNLVQAIALAMKKNNNIHTTYTQRISERYAYYQAKRNRRLWYYSPSMNLSTDRSINKSSSESVRSAGGITENDRVNGTTVDTSASVTPAFGFTSPIGGSIQFDASASTDFKDGDKNINTGISLTQPLLKGFGYAINAMAWKQSEIAEKQNILNLRSTVSSTILEVITQYRQLLSASLTYQSNRQALKDAEETLERNNIQVQIGRLPKSSLLPSKIAVQTAKNNLISASDSIRQQKKGFATLLGLKKDIDFQLEETLTIPVVTLDEKYLIDFALENRPEYIRARLSHRQLLMNLQKAENNQLWNLNLNAGAKRSKADSNRRKNTQNNYTIGLSLSIPLDTTQLKGELMDAKIAIENDEINLRQLKLEIVSQVHQKISGLDQSYKQLKIQEAQLNLQTEQVANTILSLKYGRASAYDLAQQQEQLNGTRNGIITNKIDYLNKLSELDNYLGSALATWQVVLAP